MRPDLRKDVRQLISYVDPVRRKVIHAIVAHNRTPSLAPCSSAQLRKVAGPRDPGCPTELLEVICKPTRHDMRCLVQGYVRSVGLQCRQVCDR